MALSDTISMFPFSHTSSLALLFSDPRVGLAPADVLPWLAILNGLKSLQGEKSAEESKPKDEEAENINLPEFPNPETYRSWKTTTREAVRAASDSPDEAFQWIFRSTQWMRVMTVCGTRVSFLLWTRL